MFHNEVKSEKGKGHMAITLSVNKTNGTSGQGTRLFTFSFARGI